MSGIARVFLRFLLVVLRVMPLRLMFKVTYTVYGIGLLGVEVVPKPVSDALFLPHLVEGRGRVFLHFLHVPFALRFALWMPFLSEDLG